MDEPGLLKRGSEPARAERSSALRRAQGGRRQALDHLRRPLAGSIPLALAARICLMNRGFPVVADQSLISTDFSSV